MCMYFLLYIQYMYMHAYTKYTDRAHGPTQYPHAGLLIHASSTQSTQFTTQPTTPHHTNTTTITYVSTTHVKTETKTNTLPKNQGYIIIRPKHVCPFTEVRPTFALVGQEHGGGEVPGGVQDDVLGGLQVLHEVDKVVAGHPAVALAGAVHHRRGAAGRGGGGERNTCCGLVL